MAGNRTNPGTPRDADQVARKSSPEKNLVDHPLEDEEDDDGTGFSEEEPTNPGVAPEVQDALAALQRVQVATKRRASDIESLLIRRRTVPPR